MKTKLQQIRKAAGYKSANAFADAIGMSRNTYRNYEQGISNLTLERACEFADVLCCTLDELAGRKAPEIYYDDPEQEALNGYWESMNKRGRDAVLEAVRLISSSVDVRLEKEGQSLRVSPAMGA